MGQNIFDQYTFLHFSVGVVMYFIGFSLVSTIILHVIFEFAENTTEGINFINNYLSWFWPGGKEVPDSHLNSIGDTIGVIAGWLAAKYLDDMGTQRRWIYST